MAHLSSLRFTSYPALAAALVCAGPALSQPLPTLSAAATVDDQQTANPPVGPVTDQTQGANDAGDGDDIIVTAPGARGSVISAVPPNQVLDATAVASYGASNLMELVTALSSQTQSARGRGSGFPIILLNGRRISGRGEIRNIPPEAIERVEIFPERVALDYGYSADDRVINIVLKPHYSALTTEIEGGVATDGGRWKGEGEASWLRLAGNSRINLTANYQHQSLLTEAQRGVIYDDLAPSINGVVSGGPITGSLGVPAGGGSLAAFETAEIQRIYRGRYRSLLPSTTEWTLDGTVSQPISDTIGFSANVSYAQSKSDSLLGITGDTISVPGTNAFNPFGAAIDLNRAWTYPQALAGTSETKTFHAGFTSEGRFGRWRWTVTGNADNTRSNSVTDRGLDVSVLQALVNGGANPFTADPSALVTLLSPNVARSNVWSGDSDVTLNGPLFRMPAGTVRMTVQGGISYVNSDATSLRTDATTTTELSRTVWSTSTNIDVPLTSRDEGVLGFVGDLSANARYGIKDVSDFGGINSLTAGLTWSPINNLGIMVSWVREETAPTIQQLGAAELITPLRTIFDYSTNTTVLATVISGGNPKLRPERRRDFTIDAMWQPIADTDLRLNFSYARTRSFDTTSAFPELTPEIEAAFPGRVIRDSATGQIISVDQKPVNFARSLARQIRYGITYSEQIGGHRNRAEDAGGGSRAAGEGGAPPPPRDGAATPPPPGGPGGPGARGPGARGPGGPGGGARARGPGGGGPRGPGGIFGNRNANTGRWDVGIFHTIKLQDEILIEEGVPVLDLLNGSATGSNGGSSRHVIDLNSGYFYRGIGLRLNAKWQSGTDVITNPTTLHFSPQMTINARIFFDLNQLGDFTTRNPLFKNTRIRLAVDNLFNDRQEVRDQNGATPIRYQPAYMEAAGRIVSIELRKQF